MALRARANKVAVLIAPRETSLNAILGAVAPRQIEIIQDHQEIAAKSSRLMERSKFFEMWQRAGLFIRALGGHFEVALEIPTGEKYSAAYYPNISAPRRELPEAYVIEEDDIGRDQFSSFIAPFARVPEPDRPRIIIRAKGPAKSVAEKLDPIGDKVEVVQFGQHGLVTLDQAAAETRAAGVGDMLEAYQNFGFALVARQEVLLPDGAGDAAEILASLYQLMFKINAAIRADDRRRAGPDVQRLLAYLDSLDQRTAGKFQSELARIKALANLLHAYVFENSAEEVRNALGLARRLDDAFLVALGERLINLAEGLNPSTLHWLANAEKSFWRLGEPVQATYAMHNRLVTALSISSAPVEFVPFLDAPQKLKEIAPYAERLSTIYQGVGLLHLVSDNLQAAHDLFEAAEAEPGTWLHRAESRTSKLMCRHLLGYTDDYELEAAANSFAQQLGTLAADYHHLRLFYNLLRMAEGRPCADRIASIAVTRNILSPLDASDLGGLFARIAARMPVSAPGGRYQGPRGEFFERTLLAPTCSFIWH